MKKQRGALTFITPMIMVTIILLGALAMDGARLYSLKREMQSIANTAATIAVNDMQTCSGNSIYGGADWSGDSAIQDAVGEDVERLGGDLTITPVWLSPTEIKYWGSGPRIITTGRTRLVLTMKFRIPRFPRCFRGSGCVGPESHRGGEKGSHRDNKRGGFHRHCRWRRG
ncbi:Tad domain-containing protein [Alcanivorax sp. IO_7]|nr:Tad domain-containing protein [Alcanivorax sp. IO_7]